MTLLMRERKKYKEGLEEGEANRKAFGIIEFAKDIGYSDKDIISALQKTLRLDMNQAKDYLKRFYEKNFKINS